MHSGHLERKGAPEQATDDPGGKERQVHPKTMASSGMALTETTLGFVCLLFLFF